MSNELQIKPLLRYEITFDNDETIVFTAESHQYDATSGMFQFFRTGNIIREVSRVGVEQIVTRPDEG